jgi:hypothetical protein
MNAKIYPEVWNTLTRVQKRAIAENIHLEKRPLFHDLGEVAAWISTLSATAAVIGFAFILLR